MVPAHASTLTETRQGSWVALVMKAVLVVMNFLFWFYITTLATSYFGALDSALLPF